jgi:3-deoxy-7-phosphoheptulonate synthase / chorismate mutase
MEQISKLRIQIDEVDKKILESLKERKEIIKKIKEAKNEENISIKDPAREKKVLEKAEDEYQKNIYKKILEESRKLQE